MSKRSGVKSDVAENGDRGFLTRWSARKTRIAQGLEVPEAAADHAALAAADADHHVIESDADAALSDAELLEKYELPDPADIEEEAGLDKFFDGETPERLRQMALRRLWRINPFFGFVDEMVEYGEDYTDAATVIEGMQTAYQAGKGYLQKVLSPEEEAAEQAKLAAGEVPRAEDDDITSNSDRFNEESTAVEADEAGEGAETTTSQSGQSAEANATNRPQPEKTGPVGLDVVPNIQIHQQIDTVTQADRNSFDNAMSKPVVTAGAEPQASRPKRMKFNIKSDS